VRRAKLLVALTLGIGMVLVLARLVMPGTSGAPVRAASAGELRVCPGGPPACDYASVQNAVDAADDGTLVKVAQGTYTGVHARAGVTQVLYISETVTVRGGYTTADWETPNADAHPTSLDAQGLGRVVYVTGTISPTLIGLQLTGGDATGLGGAWDPRYDAGGGVYVGEAAATISGCVVFSNTASTADRGYGGGLYFKGSNATVEGNSVSGNTASTAGWGYGGGLCLEGSPARVLGNTVAGNTATTARLGHGGGMSIWASEATIEGNTVQNNVASSAGVGHGGGLSVRECAATLKSNTVQGNTGSTASRATGGGLYLRADTSSVVHNTVVSNTACTASMDIGYGGGLGLVESSATLEYNTVRGNAASTAWVGYGGGLYLLQSDASVENTTVERNTASTADAGSGGGLRLSHSDASLRNNVVSSNTASTAGWSGNGGGLSLSYGDDTLQGNLVHGNVASTAGQGHGGGLHVNNSTAMLGGNHICDNTASTADSGRGGGLYIIDSVATLEANALRGNTGSTAGTGNGGGVHLIFSDATLVGNTIQGNTASTADWGTGGGLALSQGSATLDGNSVVSNTATLSDTAFGWGGGLYLAAGNPLTLTNNLVADNHANDEGSGLWIGAGFPSDPTVGHLRHTTIADNRSAMRPGGQAAGQAVFVESGNTLAFTDTIISGHSGTGIDVSFSSTVTLEATLWHGNGTDTGGFGTIYTGTVNLYDDPAFVDPASWDYHLTAGSPAIDAGVDAGVAADIDGELRPHGPGFDIGADEFNRPPEAKAGADQSVDTLATVMLDGSGSSDPDGDTPLTYGWAQTGGRTVTLSAPSAISPTFTAPDDPSVLTFTLVVTDSVNGPDPTPDVVLVTVNNQPPVAAAGPDRAVDTLSQVTLDGSASTDPDGDTPLMYGWTQTGGPYVSLDDPAAVAPSFTAPVDPVLLTFTLVVTDSLGLPGVGPDEVVITVTNQPPVAHAGADQTIATLAPVTLDGSASSDPDGDLPLAYLWTQTGGPTLTLSSRTVVTPTFTAPDDPALLTFALVVTDSLGLPDPTPDEVVITVNNQPPLAHAGPDQSVDTLASVTLDGSASSDPDGDLPLAYLWTQTSGPAVTLSNPQVVTPTFTAPDDRAVLTFALVVTDSLGLPDPTPDTVVITVTNQPPLAHAGPDQSVDTLTSVSLDGSGSSDRDGDLPLAYWWTQTGGPAVTLSNRTVVAPTFSAPDDPAVLTFTLAVTDSLGLPDPTPDEVVITVNNQPPIADAGADQTVGTHATVALDASGSSDPDGDLPLSYWWTQTGGPAVTLSYRAIVTPTFTAPDDPAVFTFTLAVTDSLGLPDPTPDTVMVTVTNQPPVADAGPDQSVDTLTSVTLDGSGSSDPDGDLPLAYLWTQTGGPSVTLDDPASVTPAFTAPDDPALLTFTLVVTDGLGLPSAGPDQVAVTVTNQPPTADAGADQTAGAGTLVTLDGSGSSDPDGDAPLSYLWTQTGGPMVALSSHTLATPTFSAPDDPTVLTFTLAVTDSLGLPDPIPDQVVVTVSDLPIADAGADQTVSTHATVALDGSGSSDPDGDLPLAYLWTQTGGPMVTLSNSMVMAPTFTAPDDPTVLTFTLAVTDSLGLADPTPDEVTVTVLRRIYLPLVMRERA
jgi:hypothetical protein